MCPQPDTGHEATRQVEVADIFRTHGAASQQRQRLSGGQRRVMRDLIACRTAALGGQLAQCDHCGAQVSRYHSCQNRHCPTCQPLATVRWVEARLRDLRPLPYFPCVFTLPPTLPPLAHGNPRVLYGLLFQTASATLPTLGRDPQVAWGRTGHHDGPAYLEPSPGIPPPCPLWGARWGVGSRGGPLDTHQAPRLSLSRPSPRQGVARQISHRPTKRLCAGPSPVCRGHSALGARPDLPACPGAVMAAALSRLCQAAFCLGPARPLVPGALYASRRAQQGPTRGHAGWAGGIPGASEAPQQPAQSHNALGRGVHPTVPAARLTRRVSAQSPLRGGRQSLSDLETDRMPPPVGAAGAPRGAPGIRRDGDASPDGHRYCVLSPGPPGPFGGESRPASLQAARAGVRARPPTIGKCVRDSRRLVPQGAPRRHAPRASPGHWPSCRSLS